MNAFWAAMEGGAAPAPRLDELRNNVRRLRPLGWFEGWKAEAAPVFAAH